MYQKPRRLCFKRREALQNRQLQVLCAVVDKLPTDKIPEPGATSLNSATHRSAELPVTETGFEGFAYITLPASASLPSDTPLSKDQGAIDFILAEHSANNTTLRDTLRFPLANTVFQTGTPTTMTLATWNLRLGDNEPHPLTLLSRERVSHHAVRLTGFNDSADQAQPALRIPLIPLTWPRHVEGCMGNIVRRIAGSEGKAVNASAELEDVVPRFFKSRGEPAQSTTAWALVIPDNLKETVVADTTKLLEGSINRAIQKSGRNQPWEELWGSNPPKENTLVSRAVASGARLHRVLSGGGGWGKKAGLLSLDPVPINGVAVPVREETVTDMPDDPQDFASSLTPVVRDGDWIQFFLPPTSYMNAETVRLHNEESIRAREKETAWDWTLGTIPSTMDSIPGESWQHANVTSDISIFRHSFGALTEGGLTLTKRSTRGINGDRLCSTTTTIDVPFSRLWAGHVEGDAGSSTDVSKDSNVLDD